MQSEVALQVSVIIPTFNRPEDLRTTIESVVRQSHLPIELIVVDDSSDSRTSELAVEMKGVSAALSINLIYLRGGAVRSLPSARNIGADIAHGDVLLFLDDDVTLAHDYIEEILKTYASNPSAKGVQGYWACGHTMSMKFRILNAYDRAFFLFHFTQNHCDVLPSLSSNYPLDLKKTVKCEWLSGCNQSYRKCVFSRLKFDEQLIRYAPGGEDIDFSFRVCREFPSSLFITPKARLRHRTSGVSRTPSRNLHVQICANRMHIFYKNREPGLTGRFAFYWSMVGLTLKAVATYLSNRRDRTVNVIESIKNLLCAELLMLRHRNAARSGDLSWVSRHLDG